MMTEPDEARQEETRGVYFNNQKKPLLLTSVFHVKFHHNKLKHLKVQCWLKK
jgi:hypothetical protein